MEENNRQKILVTGANGFIGSYLCPFLRENGYFIRAALRRRLSGNSIADEYVETGDLIRLTDWKSALVGIDFVIHLAGYAHFLKNKAVDSVESFCKVNVLVTERLARSCVEAGVKRFIFISSVKVSGEGRDTSYTESDTPAPEDAYGISKLEAEDVLKEVARETGLEVIILRLPLVYGPGVKANFKSLVKLALCGLPLPFKSIHNQRSFLYVGNLADAIITCIEHPKAAGEIFLLSDGQDVSTPDLIKMIASAMGKKAKLFSFPLGPLKFLCKTIGKGEGLDKLTGTLLVDSSKIRNLLSWNPPFTLEKGIRETVRGIEK